MSPQVRRNVLCALCLLLGMAVYSSDAFVTPAPIIQQRTTDVSTSQKEMVVLGPGASFMDATSSIQISAATLDPTTMLSDILGGLLGTPAILMVPILAALGVASLIAFFIVSYANPEVEDDEI